MVKIGHLGIWNDHRGIVPVGTFALGRNVAVWLGNVAVWLGNVAAWLGSGDLERIWLGIG